MTHHRFSDLKVGLTVFVGIALLGVFLFVVGMQQDAFVPTFPLRVFVQDIDGLTEGAMVTLGGLKIGEVRGMEFDGRGDTNGIIVTLELREEHHHAITTNSIASIKTIGVLGDKFIDISIGNSGEIPLPPNAFLPVKGSVGMESVAHEVQSAVRRVSAVAADVDSTVVDMRKGKGVFGVLLQDPEVARDLRQTMRSVAAASEAVSSRRGTVGKAIYDDVLYNELCRVSHALAGISDSMAEGKGSLGKLIRDDSLYVAVLTLSQQLRDAAGEIAPQQAVGSQQEPDGRIHGRVVRALESIDSLATDIRLHPERYVHVSVF